MIQIWENFQLQDNSRIIAEIDTLPLFFTPKSITRTPLILPFRK